MWSSYAGQGRASCISQLPGTINHFCFWLLHCFRIVPPSLSKWRLDPCMTSNGFKWGCAQAILSSSISGVGLTTTKVLIALAADLHTNKPWQGQHKFWKYVSPIRTYFAWLPEQLARTYCRAALDRRCCGIQCTDSLHPNGPMDMFWPL